MGYSAAAQRCAVVSVASGSSMRFLRRVLAKLTRLVPDFGDVLTPRTCAALDNCL